MIPDLSVVWVVGFVLTLSVVLDRLLFRPLLRIMREREQAIRSARELAEDATAKAKAATAEFEAKTLAARTDVDRQIDAMRREALDRRSELIEQTRQEADTAVAEATARIRAQVDEARARLEREAGGLADAVVERVLGRKVS
jgi:F-type H+-transporting ATPase subunit b